MVEIKEARDKDFKDLFDYSLTYVEAPDMLKGNDRLVRDGYLKQEDAVDISVAIKKTEIAVTVAKQE